MKIIASFLLWVISDFLTSLYNYSSLEGHEKRIHLKLRGLGLNSTSCVAHRLGNFGKAKLL